MAKLIFYPLVTPGSHQPAFLLSRSLRAKIFRQVNPDAAEAEAFEDS
jgi:hypothetical protein